MKWKIAGCVAAVLVGMGLAVLVRSAKEVNNMLNGMIL